MWLPWLLHGVNHLLQVENIPEIAEHHRGGQGVTGHAQTLWCHAATPAQLQGSLARVDGLIPWADWRESSDWQRDGRTRKWRSVFTARAAGSGRDAFCPTSFPNPNILHQPGTQGSGAAREPGKAWKRGWDLIECFPGLNKKRKLFSIHPSNKTLSFFLIVLIKAEFGASLAPVGVFLLSVPQWGRGLAWPSSLSGLQPVFKQM